MPLALTKKNGGSYALDVRNYTCPYPEFYTAKVLDNLCKGQSIEVIIDSPPAYDAITKLPEKNKCKILYINKTEDGWNIILTKIA